MKIEISRCQFNVVLHKVFLLDLVDATSISYHRDLHICLEQVQYRFNRLSKEIGIKNAL